MARVASDDGKWALSLRLAQRALKGLDNKEEPDPVLRARILVALAYNNSELGHPERARQLLDEAAECRQVLPAVMAARGLILVRTGRADAGLKYLDEAVAQLRESSDVDGLEDLAGALINRGLLHIVAGRLVAAAADTEAAGTIARQLHRGEMIFMAEHNLGFVRYLEGDLPAALAAMEGAAAAWPRAAQDGVSPLDRARVLAAAGLIDAAGEHIDQALEIFHLNRATADLVDAYSVRAELDLLAGNPGAAAVHARRAEMTARRRGNGPAALAARTLLLEAVRVQRVDALRRSADGAKNRNQIRKARRDAAHAEELATKLDATGLAEEARAALLLAADALLDAGDVAAAQGVVQEVRGRPSPSKLAGRLYARLVDARLDLATGHRSEGLANIRAGLDELSKFQATFGSQDLQTAGSIHGRELARLGLHTAMETGSPEAIFQWLERARGVTTRLSAVRPPADPRFARELAEFRAGYEQSRQAVLSGQPDPSLERRTRTQRRKVQTMAWATAGSGEVRQPMTLDEVQRRLADVSGSPGVIAYLRGAGQLYALVISTTSATLERLGPFDSVQASIRRVSADLDLLAAPRIPGQVRAVAARSLETGLAVVSAALIGRLADGLPRQSPVIIAGVGILTTVPWGLLPDLAGRPVWMSASVTTALDRRPGLDLANVLSVAGPALPHAAAEADMVAGLHPGARSLVGSAATGANVLDEMPHGGLLHIAAHGYHEVESPLFSWVQLADGPLYGYDIAPNPALPDHVVLSSCDVGRSDERRAGEEPLGLAAALLRSGVSTVIAGVSRVSDEVAAHTMVRYHSRLVAGDAPAVALAAAIASADGAPVPFTCFGVGA